jgi:predicted dehydrogenase
VSDAAEVLESDAEVLVIVTPPDSHVELAKAALLHGKHVVVEKPLGTTPAEAKKLVEFARSRHLHILASPFVQLSPTFRALWTRVTRGDIGDVHSGRALYGNLGSAHAAWYHKGGIGPLAEAGIYNIKSLTAFIGPVSAVYAARMTALRPRVIAGQRIANPDPDVVHVLIQHQSGALSSMVASHAIWAYRRTAIELYGTKGTANLLGDDWDPRGYELWPSRSGVWEVHDPIDPTWHWSDGLREIVTVLRERRSPLASLEHDLHVLDVIEAASLSSNSGQAVEVTSTYDLPDLTLKESGTGYIHDHTRSPDEQQ